MEKLEKIIRLLLLCFLEEFGVGQGALLYSEIAEGLCRNWNGFQDSKSLAPKLEEHHVTPRIAASLFRFTKCAAGRSCSPFKYASLRTSTRLRGGAPKKSAPELEPYERKVMVEFRNQFNCLPEVVGCVANCNGPNRRRRSPEEEAEAGLSVEEKLQKHAKETQADVLKILHRKSRSMGFEVESLWIANIVSVSGSDVETVKELLKDREDVKDIRLEEMFSLPTPEFEDAGPETRDAQNSWWHEMMDIPKLHAMGIDGRGVTVGILDGGVDGLHYALRDNFRGAYSWFDPYYRSETPNDKQFHGTHVAGIMVGANGMGVAPKATWMACKTCLTVDNCGSLSALICFQFFLCPTHPNGTKPDCSKKPATVNSSWGSKQFAGSSYVTDYLENSIKCWKQAGIIPTFAAGNSGPNCGTFVYPGASPNVISVGNVAQNFRGPLKGIMAHTSSRGPAHRNWGPRIKPDVSAPGTNIRSASPGNQLRYLSGTSMAAPQVGGVIALMYQRNPGHKFDSVKAALIESCGPVFYAQDQGCGQTSQAVYPNFVAGYGLINAYKAVFANSSAHLPTYVPPNGTLPHSTRRRKRRSTVNGTGQGSSEEGSTVSGPRYTGPPTFASRKTLIPRNYSDHTTRAPGNGTNGTGGTGAPGPAGNGTGGPAGNSTRGNSTGGPPGTGGTGGPTPPKFTAFTRYTRRRLITKEYTGVTPPQRLPDTTTGRYDPLLPRDASDRMRPRSFRQFY